MAMKQGTPSRCLEVRFWNPNIHEEICGTAALFCLTQQENREDPSFVPEMILACVYIRSEANDDMAFFLTWETFPHFFWENPHLTFCVYDIVPAPEHVFVIVD